MAYKFNPLTGKLERSWFAGASRVVASENVALSLTSETYQFVDPNGENRTVTLPALSAADAGRAFSVKNTGTSGFFLKVQSSEGVQIGPFVGGGFSLAVVWTGTVWEAL